MCVAEAYLNLGNAFVTNMVGTAGARAQRRTSCRRWDVLALTCPPMCAAAQDYVDALRALQASVQTCAQAIEEPLARYALAPVMCAT